jgi:N-terminal domain of galactosyltransferase
MALPPLTVAFLTFRQSPRFEWFQWSLERELRSMPDFDRKALQVVVVDGRYPRRRFPPRLSLPFEQLAPKPTVWQGPHRLTTQDYFCAANSRNTAFARARHGHVVFVDDLSVLLPGWLKAHVHAATHDYVLCGITNKCKDIMVAPDGTIVSSTPFPPGVDSRLGNFPEGDGIFPCSGGWLYGGTFSVPLEAALRVNGQDEVYDGIGGEDYDFGTRLERAGMKVFISRSCGTLEDEDAHHAEASTVRLDKPWPPTERRAGRSLSPAGWSMPAEPDNVSDGPYSSNYLFHRSQRESARVWTLGNAFNLRDLRADVLAGKPFPIPTGPTQHWVDGQPLAEM